MSAYPWGGTHPERPPTSTCPTRALASTTGGSVFREQGRPPLPNAAPHDWAARRGARAAPRASATGHGVPRAAGPAGRLPGRRPGARALRRQRLRQGRRAGGCATRSTCPPAARRRSGSPWPAPTRARRGAARATTRPLRDPEARAARQASRAPRGAAALHAAGPARRPAARRGRSTGRKQNLADSVQLAEDLQLRWRSPRASSTRRPRGRWRGSASSAPASPTTRGCSRPTASTRRSRRVAAGQFEPIEDHLRALRDVSVLINGAAGKIVHEVVTRRQRLLRRERRPRQHRRDRQVPERARARVALDRRRRFRDELYGAGGARHALRGGPARRGRRRLARGPRQRRARGHGRGEARQHRLRDPRPPRPGRPGALQGRRRHGRAGPSARAQRRGAPSRRAWWMPEVPQHADSLATRGNAQIQQRHWIGVTPMEVELLQRRARGARPGDARARHRGAGASARPTATRASSASSTPAPPGCDGGPTGAAEQQIFTLNTAVMAVGEGNYGRLGAATSSGATRRGQPAPAAAGAGRAARRDARGRRRRPLRTAARSTGPSTTAADGRCRPGAHYGTLWPVVHQQLGVRPDLGRRRLEVTPQLPPYERRIAGRRIRLGRRRDRRGRLARRSGLRAPDCVDAHVGPAPADARGDAAAGRGRRSACCSTAAPVADRERVTNRGLEVAAERAARPAAPRARGRDPLRTGGRSRSARDGARSPSAKRGSGSALAGQHARGVLGDRRPVLVAVARAAAEQPDPLVLGVAREQEVAVGRQRVVAAGRRAHRRAGQRGEAAREVVAGGRDAGVARPAAAAPGSTGSPSRSEATFMPYGSIEPWP